MGVVEVVAKTAIPRSLPATPVLRTPPVPMGRARVGGTSGGIIMGYIGRPSPRRAHLAQAHVSTLVRFKVMETVTTGVRGTSSPRARHAQTVRTAVPAHTVPLMSRVLKRPIRKRHRPAHLEPECAKTRASSAATATATTAARAPSSPRARRAKIVQTVAHGWVAAAPTAQLRRAPPPYHHIQSIGALHPRRAPRHLHRDPQGRAHA